MKVTLGLNNVQGILRLLTPVKVVQKALDPERKPAVHLPEILLNHLSGHLKHWHFYFEDAIAVKGEVYRIRFSGFLK